MRASVQGEQGVDESWSSIQSLCKYVQLCVKGLMAKLHLVYDSPSFFSDFSFHMNALQSYTHCFCHLKCSQLFPFSLKWWNVESNFLWQYVLNIKTSICHYIVTSFYKILNARLLGDFLVCNTTTPQMRHKCKASTWAIPNQHFESIVVFEVGPCLGLG